jgi:hypothetical protein
MDKIKQAIKNHGDRYEDLTYVIKTPEDYNELWCNNENKNIFYLLDTQKTKGRLRLFLKKEYTNPLLIRKDNSTSSFTIGKDSLTIRDIQRLLYEIPDECCVCYSTEKESEKVCTTCANFVCKDCYHGCLVRCDCCYERNFRCPICRN